MERRSFLKLTGLTASSLALAPHIACQNRPERPNILVIMTDQQWADGMSCVLGKDYINTPNMDGLAEQGVRFSRAYAPNPLCVPMRTSMITGTFPHQTGQQTNDYVDLDVTRFHFLGRLFKDAGYETAWFGKWHIPVKKIDNKVHGFDTFVEKPARLDPSYAANFLRAQHDRPFLAFASFLSPHEICQWARKEELPGGPIPPAPPVDQRPPLVDNFDPPENETDIMAHMRKAYQAHRLFPVGNYTIDDWRRHVWGYYRLIERADAFVGHVLSALRESGQEENTVVVFLSDHGDCHGAHHWNQKTVFYDESARVPLLISWKGKTKKAVSEILVNTGTDLLPTLCDFAGIAVSGSLPGKSLKEPALGHPPQWNRPFIVSQNHMVQCEPVDGVLLKPQGRMVRSERYKYCLYSDGHRRESLVDMITDPGEMINQAENPRFKSVLEQHRKYLRQHAQEHGDQLAMKMLQAVEA